MKYFTMENFEKYALEKLSEMYITYDDFEYLTKDLALRVFIGNTCYRVMKWNNILTYDINYNHYNYEVVIDKMELENGNKTTE